MRGRAGVPDGVAAPHSGYGRPLARGEAGGQARCMDHRVEEPFLEPKLWMGLSQPAVVRRERRRRMSRAWHRRVSFEGVIDPFQ